MNWSTRLRRWVRIRTPPVREASMKPTAATVLPAPVACSNQKRRSAPGSSGASVDHLLGVVLGGRLLSQSCGSSSGASSSSSSSSPRPRHWRQPHRRHRPSPSAPFLAGTAFVCRGRPSRCPSPCRLLRRRSRPAARPSARSACPESASTWCGLSSAPSRSFGGSSASRRSRPEQQREVAAPLDRRILGAVVDLGQGGVESAAAGGARGAAPPAPRRRAGRARGRTPPPDRYRRLMELPLARQLRWSWP